MVLKGALVIPTRCFLLAMLCRYVMLCPFIATCGGELPFASSILNIHSELFRRSIFLSAQIGQLPAPKSLQVHDTIRSANIKLESRRRRTKGSVVGEEWCQNAAPLRWYTKNVFAQSKMIFIQSMTAWYGVLCSVKWCTKRGLFKIPF